MAFQFKQEETVATAIHRVLKEQIAKAAAELQSTPKQIHQGVHNARKCIKKIRSVLRLIRSEIPQHAYRNENIKFRDAARCLASTREAGAMLETFEQLCQNFPELSGEENVFTMRRQILQWRDDTTKLDDGFKGTCAVIASKFHDSSCEIHKIFPSQLNFSSIAAAFKRIYKQGKKARKMVEENFNEESSHEWRKLVKDYYYYSHLFGSSRPEFWQKRSVKLKELSEFLGNYHDLCIFKKLLKTKRYSWGKENCRAFKKIATREQEKLRLAAQQIGAEVYRQTAADFYTEICSHWQMWKKSA